MKKYNNYFNKRYFPEDGQTDEEGKGIELTEYGEEESSDVIMADETSEGGLAGFVPDGPDTVFGEEKESKPEPAVPIYTPQSIAVKPESATQDDEGEATIISKSAVITGELVVAGDIHLFGKIKGNVSAQGNLEISGKVIGNVNGKDVELSRCELKGDIQAKGFVFMDKDSLMIGNVTSQDLTLDGKVKGDISVARKVYVRSNAVIMGNIRAGSISIDEGASLQGQVIITNPEMDGMNINEDSQPAGELEG